MSKTLTKEDLKLIEGKISASEQRLSESIRGANQNFATGISRLEKLITDQQQSTLEAISEVLLNDQIKSVETDLQQVKDRLAVLESAQ